MYLWYIPTSTTIFELTTQREDLAAKLTTTKAAASGLNTYAKKYEDAKTDFKLALQLLPDKREIPGLLDSISTAGRIAGLEFLLFQPQDETPKDFYSMIPVSIKVRGGYHSFGIFLDNVSKLPRIVNITNVTIGRNSGDTKEAKVKRESKSAGMVIEASCVAVTYRFVEGQEEKQATEENAKGSGAKDNKSKDKDKNNNKSTEKSDKKSS